MFWTWAFATIPLGCNIAQVASELIRGNYPTAILFAGYAIAQVGAIWMLVK